MPHTLLQLVLAGSLVSFQRGGLSPGSFETMKLNLQSVSESSKGMALKLELASESPQRLVKRQLAGPHPRVSDSLGLGQGLESEI